MISQQTITLVRFPRGQPSAVIRYDLHGMHTFYQLSFNGLHASAIQSLWLRNQAESNDVEPLYIAAMQFIKRKQKPGIDETASPAHSNNLKSEVITGQTFLEAT